MPEMKPESHLRKRQIIVRSIVCVFTLSSGIALMGLLASFKTAPEQKTYSETTLKVRAVTAELRDISVSTTEYGTARPLRTVTISSEVTGKIIATREGLKSGTIVSKGEKLLSIDSRDYVIALTVAMAQVEKLDSELRSLELSMSIDALRLSALERTLRFRLRTLRESVSYLNRTQPPKQM